MSIVLHTCWGSSGHTPTAAGRGGGLVCEGDDGGGRPAAVGAAVTVGRDSELDTEVAGPGQVWSLTQIFSVDFLQLRISVQK